MELSETAKSDLEAISLASKNSDDPKCRKTLETMHHAIWASIGTIILDKLESGELKL